MVMIFVAAFALYGLYCFGTVNQVKVNGPFYERIVQGKDVIADILPPPAYLIETYLLAFEMYDDKNGENLPRLMVDFAKAKDEYLARHAFWQANLPEGELRTALVQTSYEPGARMIATVERDFLPALQAGNREKAEALLHGAIRRDYQAHRAAIDQVVSLAMVRNRDDEAGAALAVKSRAIGQVGLGLFLIAMLTILAWRWTKTSVPAPGAMPGLGAGTRA
jgi:hypothetical protein